VELVSGRLDPSPAFGGEAEARVGRDLAVADHASQGDLQALLKPARQSKGGREHPLVGQHLSVVRADVLDPDRPGRDAESVLGEDVERSELGDPSLLIDDEVHPRRFRAGAPVADGRALRRARGPVLDDEAGLKGGRSVH
jgi:hypothetical protein